MRDDLPLRWDVFCRVVDNHGDAGVCWRLARHLAGRGQRVRLVIDDLAPLAWMAPEGAAGVEVAAWPGPAEPGDVAIEAFGCDPPPGYVAAMRAAATPPVWINLEYLSAEPYVERSHGLPSPQPGGLVKWFFFPGFTARTGGLLREPGLAARRATFDRDAWLHSLGIARAAGERVVVLFCYANANVGALLKQLAPQPTLLLLTPGPAQQQVGALPVDLRAVRLPWLSQVEFDHLLWSADINLVRGEDSLVRAIWAGAPFAWQAYPQGDGAHHAKVQAMLAAARLPGEVQDWWRGWNGRAGGLPAALPPLAPWREAVQGWRQRLEALPDLAASLHEFALGKSRGRTLGGC